MYALDTNLLVHAHNVASPSHEACKSFVEEVVSRRGAGSNQVCLPAQVLMEFMNVITWRRLEAPLPLADAVEVARDYLATGIQIVNPRSTQLETVLQLLGSITSRKTLFDVALAATLRDNGIPGIYTINVRDFEGFTFLDVRNPIEGGAE